MTKRTIKSCSVKSLAIFLSVLMIFYLIPATAYASLFEATDAEPVVSENAEYAGEVFEDVSRREENVKHFRLEDGTYMAAQYDTAIHTLDENGDWQDIDNTLSESGSEYSTSNARIKFAKKLTGNESIFTLHENNRKITLSLDGAIKKTIGVATNTETEFDETATTLQKMMTLDKLSSRIIYEDILDGVNLEYIVNGNNIKENIIVKEKKDSYVYSFTMKLNNLTAVMMDDGSIIICDESSGEAVYNMPAPVMWDSAYNTSNAASMTLTAHGNGSYTITVTADSEWMNSAERTYPITIDPAISTEWGLTTYTCVDSSNPNQSWTFSTLYKVSNTISTYVKFDSLPSIPNYAYITDANVCMAVSDATAIFDGYIGAYDVLTDWDTSITYNDTIKTLLPEGQVSTNSDYLLDYNYIKTITRSSWPFYWNITNKVKEWYSVEDNYGIAFKIVADTTASGTLSFVAAMYPNLTVAYKDMYGLEDYWSFASHSAGLAGDGYVNLATGNLVLNINALTTIDGLMPFTSSITYNSSMSSKYYTSANRNYAYSSPIAPLGFMSNLFQTIVPRTRYLDDGTVETYYIYTDGDGTEHSFLPSKIDGETNVYYDEDGLHLKLTVSSSTFQTIEDSSDNSYIFSSTSSNSGGTSLSSIISVDGYQLIIDRDETNNVYNIQINTSDLNNPVTQMTVSYGADGLIQYFLNPHSQQAVLLYYTSLTAGKRLDRIVYAHSEEESDLADWNNYYTSETSSGIVVDATCDYTYDYQYQYKLESIRDNLNQREIRYEYDLSDRITKITEYGGTSSNLTTGQSIGIEYGNSHTTIRTSGNDDIYGNSDDILNIYVFDNEGRCISNYSTDVTGYYLYGATSGEYVDDNEKANNSIKSTVTMGNIPTNYLLNGDFSKADSTLPNYWSCDSGVTLLTTADPSIPDNYDNQGDYTNFVEMLATSTTATTISQDVILIPGTYTLSTSLLCLEDSDITVTLCVKQNYSIVYSEDIPVRSVADSSIFAEQSEGSLTFEVSGTGYQSYTVSLEVKLNSNSSEDAEIYVQHISLSRGEGSNLYNKIAYGSFEESVYGGSTGWVAWNDEWLPTAGSFSLTNECYTWNPYDTALRITSRGVNYSDYVSQTLYEATQAEIDDYKAAPYSIPSKSYQVSARGFSADALNSPNSTFGIVVEVSYIQAIYVNNRWSFVPTEQMYYLPFQADVNYIQYVLGHIEIPEDHFIKKITIKCDFSNQSKGAYGYFDDVGFCFVGNSNTLSKTEYNTDGYVSEIRTGNNYTWYVYSGKKVTAEITNNSIIEYTYYSDEGYDHRVRTATLYTYTADVNEENGGYTSSTTSSKSYKTNTAYTYNSFGQVIETTITSGNKTLTTKSSYITDSDSRIVGLCDSQTDELGNTTYYMYNDSTGALMAVLYPDGNALSYLYDPLGRLTYVYPATWNTSSVSGGNYSVNNIPYVQNTSNEKAVYGYDSSTGRLSTISTATTQYNFAYDTFGNSSEIKVGKNSTYYSLAKYEYYSNNGKLKKLTYGNGDYEYYLYDELDRLSEVCYNSSTIASFKYTYDANGNLSKFYDYTSNKITSYVYYSNGMLKTYYVNAIGDTSTPTSIDYAYDDQGRTTGILYNRYGNVGTVSKKVSYYTTVSYDADGFVANYITNLNGSSFAVNYLFNQNGTIATETHGLTTSTTLTYGYSMWYQYNSGIDSNSTTTQVGSVTTYYNSASNSSNSTTAYTYDSVGNITAITIDGVLKYSYEYDDLGQLTRENNAVSNRTYVYTYDNAGNIESKTIYAYTTGSTESLTPYSTKSYSYTNSAWGDLLMSYGGTSFEYDNAGNPTYGSFGGYTVDLEWENGRQLSSIYAYDEFELSFTYNHEGIRTSKDSNGTVHYYTLAGDMILSEEWMSGTTQYLLLYHYDANGQPIGMSYRRSTYAEGIYDHYLFIKNIQGDITGIMDEDGNILVTYAYDAWGNHISTVYSNGGGATGARFNPFRYRGYYYDTETCLYYLNSRYYDPASGRFINPDSASYIGADGTLIGYNLFAYCGNNPVMMVDYNGNLSFWNFVTFTVGVATIVGLAVAVTYTGGAAGVICGAAFLGATAGGATGALIGATIGGIVDGWEGAIDGACTGFMIGTLAGAAIGALVSSTSSVQVIGSAQKTGTLFHGAASNIEAAKMTLQPWKYSKVYLNRCLNTAGLTGRKIPDVIGIAKKGEHVLVEVVSKSQTVAEMAVKADLMKISNVNTTSKIIGWAAKVSRWF